MTSKTIIRKIARIEDMATGTFLEAIEFLASASESRQIQLPPSVVSDAGMLERKLRDAGAVLPKDDDELQGILSELAKSDAPEEWAYESQTGWAEEKQIFVTTRGVIGVSSSGIIGINPARSVKDLSGQLSTAGSWESWRDTVAEYASQSSTMMLAICLAFAAPLLTIRNMASFMICLFARTRTGKSIATLVGASVIGIARSADLLTWRLTENNLEQRLTRYNDCLFPIDDFMTLKGSSRARYKTISEVAYLLAQGWATGRHDSFTRANEGARGHWHCIGLTSNESAIRDVAREAKLERPHGETIRLIDQPAIPTGHEHIFDRLEEESVDANWKREMFSAIAEACEQNCGRAFDKYIEDLIALGPRLNPYIAAKVQDFVDSVCNSIDGAVAREVAERYGIIYAGGMLAIRFGLVTWNTDELFDAIRKCYINAREMLPDDGVTLRQGIQALKVKLVQLPAAAMLAADNAEIARIDGYKDRRGLTWRFVIKREVFNALFVSISQKDLVIDWLIQKRRITLMSAATSDGLSKAQPKEQFIWPDRQRRRSFQILWSRKAKAKEVRK